MEKRRRKKWAWLALASLLTLPITGTAQETAVASSGIKSGSYIKNGTYHIDQFGEYDISAEVTVTDGKITDVEIAGSNFGGTYAEVNKGKLQTAVDGIVGKFLGLEDDDVEGIKDVDAVTSATYSSNGIKKAVANALELELEEDSGGDVPKKKPESGVYDVTAAVRSDVVDHSLVQNETTKALLTVSDDGKMSLSYTMVSGTEQEPMYILGFNGYYIDNNPGNELSMMGVTYETEERGDYKVVTDVTFPLTGLSQYYYNNTCIYVPAMSGLNGEINGIYFENGKFNVKTIVTIYWDTLTKHEDSEKNQQSMEVSAHVDEQTSKPSSMIQIPTSLSMGKLKSDVDNVQPYEIRVSIDDPEEMVTVSTQKGGVLYSGQEELPFANDFGAQTVGGTETVRTTDIETETVLNGNITIKGKDVAEATPGNYTGITKFTITYGDATEDTEMDVHNLKDGVYAVAGNMVKVDQSTLSMADKAILHTIKLTVKDGIYSVTLNMKGMNISGKLGYLGELRYFLTGYTKDQYGYPKGELGDAKVESYQTDENGDRIYDEYGTDYPDLITFELIPEALKDGFVPLQVYVPVMDSISEGLGDQSVYLALDWATLKTADENDPIFTDDEDSGNNDAGSGGSGLTGGSSLTGGSTLGSSSLGSSSLGNSSLGSSSLNSGSDLSSVSSVKTDDISTDIGRFAALLAIGCMAILAGVMQKRSSKKDEKRS